MRIHGEVPRAYAEQLQALDRRGVVELAGAFSHAELPAILAGLDAAVIPSMWWDCAPLVVAECLAGRVPVVGANMGGIPDVVEHERNGLLFDGRSAESLAAALDRLAGEPGLLERLQAGIGEPRCFTTYVDELEQIYVGDRATAPRRDDRPVATRWVGDQSTASSLSTINREVGERLRAGHPEIALERRATDGPLGDAPTPHAPEVEVRHQWPPDLTRPAAAGSRSMQPWEFGSLPRDWQPGLQRGRRRGLGAVGVRAHDVPRRRRRRRPRARRAERRRPRRARARGAARRRCPTPRCACCSSAARSRARAPTCCSPPTTRRSPGRDDVLLVIKDLGGQTYYRGLTMADALRERAASGALPRVHYVEDELTRDELAALYRACDVLVHPYRGEGFAMPVLEAMACGLPVVVTAGGPTDEFCPDDACWRDRLGAPAAARHRDRHARDARAALDARARPRPTSCACCASSRRRPPSAPAAASQRAAPPRRTRGTRSPTPTPTRIDALARRAPRTGPAPEPLALADAPGARAARHARLARPRPARRAAARLGRRLPGRRARRPLPARRPAGRRRSRAVGVARAGRCARRPASISRAARTSPCSTSAMHGRDGERVHRAAHGYVAAAPRLRRSRAARPLARRSRRSSPAPSRCSPGTPAHRHPTAAAPRLAATGHGD